MFESVFCAFPNGIIDKENLFLYDKTTFLKEIGLSFSKSMTIRQPFLK
jgi:hypothetical protein